MKQTAFFVGIILFLASATHAEEPDFSKFVRLADEGKIEKAYSGLRDLADSKLSKDNLHVKYFALGNWAIELKKWAEARGHLQEALKFGDLSAGHINYLIGHSYKAEGDYVKAAESFNRALDFNPAQNIVYQTRFEFSEMALILNKPDKARGHLLYLEKKWRGRPQYPEILWRLLGVELKDGRRHLACRWARKLYTRYPGASFVANWGIDLEQNKYENISLGCVASRNDMKERIRYLNLSGLASQAKSEIDILRERARPNEKQEVDFLMVSYLEHQGYPDDALKLLISYYEQSRGDINYLNMLGKVAGRAGEYQTAIGAYYSAYKLSPQSKNGKNALFTAAFLSYQIQDYDGAYRKFSQLVDKYSGSSLARDSKWHLAWLQYLKMDYSGAEKSFRSLLNEKYYVGRRRRRRVVHPFDNDRTRYWLAMSVMRQDKFNEAKPILTELATDKSLSFYSLLSQNRLNQLPALAVQRVVASNSSLANLEMSQSEMPQLLFSPTGEKERPTEESLEDQTAIPATTLDAAENEVAEGEEGEVDDKGEAIVADKGEEGYDVDPNGESSASPDEEKVTASDFNDPKLRERFRRASNLIKIGNLNWAKWELYEIERRTSNKTYLKMLMEEYRRLGSYNRVAYIAEIYFSTERNKGGLGGARELWMYNYPQAYEKNVSSYAKRFNVSESLVLAIMRAESHFNSEAYSPVGARGLMQIMPYTATQISRLLGEDGVGDQDLLIPEVNIRLGSRYLSRLQKKFQDQVPLVAAGYNAGPHRVYSWLNTFGTLDMDEFIEHVPFVETRNYMKKVVRNYAIYNALYGNTKDTYVWLTQPVPMRVSAKPSPRENWEIID